MVLNISKLLVIIIFCIIGVLIQNYLNSEQFSLKLFIESYPLKSTIINLLKKYFPVILVICTFLSTILIDKIDRAFTTPHIYITIQGNKTGTLNIKLEVTRGTIKDFAIDCPIKGGINKFENNHSITDIFLIQANARGKKDAAFNRLEVYADNIRSKKRFNFIVYYTPFNLYNYDFTGDDIYEVTYSWLYKGDVIKESLCKRINSDEVVECVGTRVSHLDIYPGHPADPKEEVETVIRDLKNNSGANNKESLILFNEKVESLFDSALTIGRAGNHKEAIQILKNVIKLNPNYAKAWHQWGLNLAKLDKIEEAIGKFQKTIEINPTYEDAWYNYGFALVKIKRYPEAIKKFKETIRIKPDYEKAFFYWGVSLENLGNQKDAIEKYREALKINPDYDQALYRQAISLGKLGDNEEAIKKFKEVARLKPENAKAWYGWGLALQSLGNVEEAQRKFHKAKELGFDP